jgi:small subunit ribosomal protein S21
MALASAAVVADRGRCIDLLRKVGHQMLVFVRDNDVAGALRALKRKMQREGLFRELRRRRSYEKPSERRARETAESIRRRRKLMRKRMLREGY